MKKWLAAITLVLILGLVFGSAQVYASPDLSGQDQLVELKKTKQPGPPENDPANGPPGLEKKAEKQAEKDLRQAERELMKAEKIAGKKVHFSGDVTAVGAADFTLDVVGTPILFAVDENTQIKIPTLANSAGLAALNVGVKASVQAMEIIDDSEVSEEPPAEPPAEEQAATSYLALKVQVIPGKPVRIHRVGIVTNYQEGVSITILAKGESFTFLIAEGAKILPEERADQLAAGMRVTIISRRDPTGGPLTAQGIVVHPESQADEDFLGPTDILLSADTVDENALPGSVVGIFTPVDPTAGDVFTFTLVAGTGDTDNALFTITGDQLIVVGPFDYETKPSLSIRVRVTDQNGSFFEKVFTITVNDIEGDPTDISLTTTTVAENAAAGTPVGTFTATDDPMDTHTFALVAGVGDTDNALFTITGDQLITVGPFDFETKPSLSIRVRATDQNSSTFEEVFTIAVNDVTGDPIDITLSPSTVAENMIVGTTVGAFTATDPDAGDTHTFALVAGVGDTDNASFTISGANLLTAAVFDYETQSSYSIRVRVTDAAGLSFEKEFIITVVDVVEP